MEFLHPDTADSYPEAINDAGEVVGMFNIDGQSRAYLWSGGSIQELTPPPGARETWAVDINEAGQVLGKWLDEGGRVRGVLWQDGQPMDLGLPEGADHLNAEAIDDMGRVAGTYSGDRGGIFLWYEGVFHSFREGQYGHSGVDIVDMNNQGQLVGHENTGGYNARALLWTIDLELLGRP